MTVIHQFNRRVVVQIRTRVYDDGTITVRNWIVTDLPDRDSLLAQLVRAQATVLDDGGTLIDAVPDNLNKLVFSDDNEEVDDE